MLLSLKFRKKGPKKKKGSYEWHVLEESVVCVLDSYIFELTIGVIHVVWLKARLTLLWSLSWLVEPFADTEMKVMDIHKNT